MKFIQFGVLLFLLFSASLCHAQTINFDDFLLKVRTSHPFFKQEQLSEPIQAQRRDSTKGTADWNVNADTSYVYKEQPQLNFGTPERVENAGLSAGVSRLFWGTGGTLSANVRGGYTDQVPATITQDTPSGSTEIPLGVPQFYENGVSLTYSQPLLKNFGGLLSRQNYRLADFDVKAQGLNAIESQEAFLRAVAVRYIDWVELTERSRILEDRVKTAEQIFAYTKRKLAANVVERVDLLRSEDDLTTARQNKAQADVDWEGVQAELATLVGDENFRSLSPKYDIYRTEKLRPLPEAEKHLYENSRVLRSLRSLEDKANTDLEGQQELARHQLDLELSGGLVNADEDFSGSTTGSKPEFSALLLYRYPLGNTTARADVSRVTLESQQRREAVDSEYRNLLSELRNLRVQLDKLNGVLELNRKQIKTALERTKEEEKIYDQGRGDLNFVLAARNLERNARLIYASTAAGYHRLLISYRTLMDQLLPDNT